MSPEALAWLRADEPHYDCEDCWYSCATLTCDDHRRSTECDCGAETVTKYKREILAAIEKPSIDDAWQGKMHPQYDAPEGPFR